MVNEALPDWVARKKQEIEEQNQKRIAAREAEARSRKFIELGAPRFWKELVSELEFNVRACEELGIVATFSQLGKGGDDRRGYQASFIYAGPETKQQFFNVFYHDGDRYIEVYPKGQEPYSFIFTADQSGELWATNTAGTFSARTLAEHLTKGAVDLLLQ